MLAHERIDPDTLEGDIPLVWGRRMFIKGVWRGTEVLLFQRDKKDYENERTAEEKKADAVRKGER
jgi:hypothetical protein